MESMGDPEDDRQPLDGDLGWMLGTALRTYLRATEAALTELPGGARGYQVLAAAGHGDARNQGALSGRLGIDRTVLTYLIDDLEAAGLVARRPDPADRRSRLIDATPEGLAVLAHHETQVARAEAHVLAALSTEDAATFRHLLQAVACSAADRVGTDEMCRVVEGVTDGPATP